MSVGGPNRRRLAGAALVSALAMLTACAVPTPGSSGRAGQAADSRTRSVQVQPCTNATDATRPADSTGAPGDTPSNTPGELRAQLQGHAEPPVCTDGRWRFVLPPDGDAPAKRRTELWLTDESAYRDGDDAVIDMRIRADLGEAAFDRMQWHVVWQLHGPTFGDWLGPALTLQVNDGLWIVAGGNGHADHDPRDSNYMWNTPLAPFSNGQTKHIRIEAHVNNDPAQARVNAWVDGEHVLRDYAPTSPQGLSPGTLYPGQEAIQARVGLYRGTLPDGSPPTYEQVVEVWNPQTD
ncbi:MAG: heparin lyase I family protein [Dermatophilus congolensis]|nr:heparin lyase I family protein [Dermatophilus congolensis]